MPCRFWNINQLISQFKMKASMCVLGFVILDPPKTYTQDGVCLTESGMSQLQSLTVTAPRRKRTKPKLKLKIINQNSVAVLQTPPDIQSEHSRDGEMDDSRGNAH